MKAGWLVGKVTLNVAPAAELCINCFHCKSLIKSFSDTRVKDFDLKDLLLTLLHSTAISVPSTCTSLSSSFLPDSESLREVQEQEVHQR